MVFVNFFGDILSKNDRIIIGLMTIIILLFIWLAPYFMGSNGKSTLDVQIAASIIGGGILIYLIIKDSTPLPW